ncbi:MAG TPA: hypothetical protein VGX23_22450 [Actinocrinis sp.]|nr:hypothetical protein [Actinocrinis sp.]
MEKHTSSGVVLFPPGAVVAAAGATVVLGGPAAAVLIVGAANAAVGRGPGGVADHERVLRETDAARGAVDAEIWARVAANVLELGARIRLLAGRGHGAGRPLTPEPPGLAGTSVSDATRWCVRTAQDLAGVQLALHAAAADEQARQAMAWLPEDTRADSRADAAAALARYQRMLGERYEPNRASRVPIVTLTDADVQAVLRRLDPDAHEGECARVLAAAVRVPRNHAHVATSHLLGLREAVHEVNMIVIRRRLAAQWLVALEEPSVAALLSGEPSDGAVARLREVVAGERDLGDEASRRAGEALEAAADLARREVVLAIARCRYAQLGYQIMSETNHQGSVSIRLGRADWNGEHSAQLWVDESGALHGRILRNLAAEGADTEAGSGEDDNARIDRERGGEFLGILRSLGRREGAAAQIHVHPPHPGL